LIMEIGPLPDALKPGFTALGPLPDAMDPGFHCVRAHWIRGFIASRLARRTRNVVLVVPT
jgi:hypothetical protein